jgi:uncharacterized protein YbgA (DUF1722 family)
MGKHVADPASRSPADLFERYQKALLEALRLKATAAKHVNVLHHVLGYFRKDLSGDEKRELPGTSRGIPPGELPLIVPVTLAGH